MRAVYCCIIFFALVLPLSRAESSIAGKLADGFDFPVGPPDATGYYKYRGYSPRGHLGEDWNGLGGGNTDLGDAVYNIGEGIVTFARDVRMGWGNVVIIRHSYYEKGKVHHIDSLYGHLDSVYVRENERVRRGQLIGSIGTNRGQYAAHLHFEIRKNLKIGINRSAFSRGYENYHSPTRFISPRRKLSRGRKRVKMPWNTYGTSRKFGLPSKGRAKLKPYKKKSSK